MSLNQSDDLPMGERHVLIVSHGFQSAYERGFCNALASNGARVILAGSDKTDLGKLHPAIEIRSIRGSQDAGRPKWQKALNMLRYHVRLVLLAWQERHSTIHVIGLTDMPALTGIIEGLYFRAIGRKYLLTVHNLLPHDTTGWAHRWVYWLLYRVPQQLVVHTKSMAVGLTNDFQVERSRVVVMEHGCELDSGRLRDLGPTRRAEVRLLFFGGVAPYKGLDVLLDAMARLPPHFALRICGYCRSTVLEADIRRQMAALATTSHHVTWQNEYVSDETMAGEMTIADMLVLPYRHIDQSGVIFQGLKYGVPIVATRVGEFSRMVTEQIGEVCEPNDATALANAIQTLAARLDSVSRDYIASLAASYDWKLTVRALENSYA